jgi:hypothetical protein
MLEIGPTCENCGAQLLPNSLEAMICSFECTFCRKCVQEILENRSTMRHTKRLPLPSGAFRLIGGSSEILR